MGHGDISRGKDWPRRLGLATLALASLIVATGIVTGAYRGRLHGSTGYGAIVLPWLVLTQFLLLRRSAPTLSRIAGLIGAPAALVAAFYWLMAVAT